MGMAPSAIAIDHKETTILNDGKVDYINNNHGVESDVTGLASKALIQKVLKEQIGRIDVDTCEPGEEDAFYVADLGEVYRQHLRWKLNLARVKPYYGRFHIRLAVFEPALIACSCQMQPGSGSASTSGQIGNRLRLCVQGGN